jgi:hypothetical protein
MYEYQVLSKANTTLPLSVVPLEDVDAYGISLAGYMVREVPGVDKAGVEAMTGGSKKMNNFIMTLVKVNIVARDEALTRFKIRAIVDLAVRVGIWQSKQ